MASKQPYIAHNPRIFGGEAIIAGTRLLVRAVADRLADGDSIDDLIADYPHIPRAAFEAAAAYAEAMPPREMPPRKPWYDQ